MTEIKFTRSISQLKTYTKCGEQFRLERIERKQLPKRPAVWTIMGIAVHDAIMEWEKSERHLDIVEHYRQAFDRLTDEAWQSQPDVKLWFLPPNSRNVQKSIQTYRNKGFEQLVEYVEYAESAAWEALHLEREFEIVLWDVTIRGAVDRILYYPGSDEFMVEDLKTGSPKMEADFRQLAFYAFVAQFLWDIPVRSGRYWFTKLNRSSEEYQFKDELLTVDYWAETFMNLDLVISQGIFLPNPGEQCGLCAVRPWCSSQGWLDIDEDLGS